MADRFPIGRRTALAQILAAAALMAGNTAKAAVPPPQAAAKDGIAAVAGTRLEYWDTGGTGEAVVLLHPATGSARIWTYQQPALVNAGYRVIAYSRRGYGKSDPVPKENPGTAADDLRALLAVVPRDLAPGGRVVAGHDAERAQISQALGVEA